MLEYTINPGDIMIKFTAPENYVAKVTEKVTDRVTEKVTDREQQVLNLLYEDPGFTATLMAERMGVSRKTIGEYLKSLRNKGIIERVGSDRKGYWRIIQ